MDSLRLDLIASKAQFLKVCGDKLDDQQKAQLLWEIRHHVEHLENDMRDDR